MHGMFGRNDEFKSDLSSWNTQSVTSLSHMFYYTKNFSGDLSNWDTSNVIQMSSLFKKASQFNDKLPWNTEKTESMDFMFAEASLFNQPIGNWNVENVSTFQSMFNKSINFNQDIRNWNTQNARNMLNMFSGAAHFNSMLSSWDVSQVTNFNGMFNQCHSFSRKLCWNISKQAKTESMFQHTNGAEIYCFDTPTITPRPCLDDPKQKFELWGKSKLNCKWLKHQPNLQEICKSEPSVKKACTDTCDGFCYVASTAPTPTPAPVPAPTGKCEDITWKFTMWGRPNMNCKWLAKRENVEDICEDEQIAKLSCPVTCEICDQGDTLPPELIQNPTPNELCKDSTDIFTMWDRPNMNCKWLAKRENVNDICEDEQIARLSCPVTCDSCDLISSISPVPVPTSSPTPNELCKDSTDIFTMWGRPNMNCEWLAKKENVIDICEAEKIARLACPVTCDSCDLISSISPVPVPTSSPTSNELCKDSTDKFIMWDRPNMNCKWLAKKENFIDICEAEKIARISCPVTCDSCDFISSISLIPIPTSSPISNDLVSTSAPSSPSSPTPDNSCTDLPSTTFRLWNKANLSCHWLNGQEAMEKICSNNEDVKITCPATCSGFCKGGFNTQALADTNSCTDSYHTVFELSDRKNVSCNWIARLDSVTRNDLCRYEDLVRENCPDTCEGYCGLAPISLQSRKRNKVRNLRSSKSGVLDLTQQNENHSPCTDNPGKELHLNKYIDCNHLNMAIPSEREDICAESHNVRITCPDTCAGLCV